MSWDEAEFAKLSEKHRAELRLHCYRMLGSYWEADDLVQETFLRAWRRRDTFQGNSTVRTWLFRIATNACLDVLASRPHRTLPWDMATEPPPPAMIPWLQPFPDSALEAVEAGPDAAIVSKETIELAFIVAIQRLPARQRAVLILRDVLGWSAKETADLLETSTAAVNSALQRARPALRSHLPQRRLEWRSSGVLSEEARAVLRSYMEALENADEAALARVLREDALVSHQAGAGGNLAPVALWYQGRETVLERWAPALHGPGSLRAVLTHANRQPAVACYISTADDPVHRPFALVVLRIEGGLIAEISVFRADVFPLFHLGDESGAGGSSIAQEGR